MQNILITGGAGFIGSNFIRLVLDENENLTIVNFDKLTYAGNLENLRDVEEKYGSARYFFVKGDIANKNDVESLFLQYNFDVVVNFAAESHVDRSIMDSGPFVETNILGTQILLDSSKKHNIKRFLHISTDEVYGSISNGEFTEESNLAPNSPYAASKAGADLLVRSYVKTFNFPAIITRSSNNYGPYQFPEKLIPLMINNIINLKRLPVYGDGKNVREWIHVKDNSRAILSILKNGENGEIYNIGSDHEVENITLVKTLIEIISEDEILDKYDVLKELKDYHKKNNMKSLISYVTDRPGHDRRYKITSRKIHEKLDWKPNYSFHKGIKETIIWYVENQEWLKNVTSGKYREYYNTLYEKR